MKHFVSILVNAFRVGVFLILPIGIGIAIALTRGVPPGRIATTVAIPMVSIVLVFKSFSALPGPAADQAEAARVDFKSKPLWLQIATIACSVDIVFIAVTAVSTLLYWATGLSHEVVVSRTLFVLGLLVFLVAGISMPILYAVLKSVTFKELRLQPVLCFAFILTVFGPADIMSGKFPTLYHCQDKA